jgi:hypothetical protein
VPFFPIFEVEFVLVVDIWSTCVWSITFLAIFCAKIRRISRSMCSVMGVNATIKTSRKIDFNSFMNHFSSAPTQKSFFSSADYVVPIFPLKVTAAFHRSTSTRPPVRFPLQVNRCCTTLTVTWWHLSSKTR